MQRKVSFVACVMALALFLAPVPGGTIQSASGGSSLKRSTPAGLSSLGGSTIPVAAIVELESEPVVSHEAVAQSLMKRNQRMEFDSEEARAYEAQLEAEQEGFRSRATLISPNLRVVTHLSRLANAVSVEAPAPEVAQLAALPGVRRVELTKEYHATINASVPLISAPAIWDRLGGAGVAGQGMKIAILDTGIDISSALFSDNGFTAPAGFPRGVTSFTSNKVIVAKAFLRDSSVTPADENGHGTNVAGIAAGDQDTPSPLGPLSGVAPRASLGNYRVLDKTGSGRSDLIARALEEAVSDGFDVANMSFGSDAGSALSFLDQAVENAVAAGIVVVASAGNGGDQGGMTIASPGIAPSAITVGASTNAHIVASSVVVTDPAPVSPALEQIPATRGSGGSASFDSVASPLPLVDVSALDGTNRACDALPAASLTGKIALIERGGGSSCTFTLKVNNANAAGALGVIVFNKDTSEGSDGGETLVTMNVTGTTIPSVFVARSSGLALQDWVKSHPDARVEMAAVSALSFTPDVLVDFSSRGPTSLETLKPDLVAPGLSIYSGAIKESNPDGVSDPSGFDAVSGTSQSAPHVAGAAALVKQLNPTWSPEQIKSALMSSATDEVFATTQRTTKVGLLDMGAGRVDLGRAASVAATFSPPSLSFGINKLKKKNVTLTADLKIKSVNAGARSFTAGIQPLDPGEGVTVTPSVTSVTLGPGETATLTITIAALRTAAKRDYTGFVLVGGPDGPMLHVPYWVRFVKRK